MRGGQGCSSEERVAEATQLRPRGGPAGGQREGAGPRGSQAREGVAVGSAAWAASWA